MDLRVMSPTSYQTALPRDALVHYSAKLTKAAIQCQNLFEHPSIDLDRLKIPLLAFVSVCCSPILSAKNS